jgi:hypothetical protein
VSPAAKPNILVIDDQREAGDALARSIGARADVTIATPEDMTEEQLRQANLVLVDYELSGWRGSQAGLTSPPNGLALSAVIREQINRLKGDVTGVALYSGQVEKISGNLPVEVRSFVVARLNNLEWVFEKKDRHAPGGVVALASAIRQLPTVWPDDPLGASKALYRLLGLNQRAPFYETAVDDVSACHPPIHELSTATHALAVIRWMAHRILPYPTFLTDDVGLAARLRLDVAEIRMLLNGKSQLARALEGVEYHGMLSDLYGRHWWRSGLDELALDWTSGAGGIEALQTSVRRLAGKRLTLNEQDVVPVLDESTYRATRLAPLADAVRLRLDDWPPFADDAWVDRITVADSDRLRGLVVPNDLELLSQR